MTNNPIVCKQKHNRITEGKINITKSLNRQLYLQKRKRFIKKNLRIFLRASICFSEKKVVYKKEFENILNMMNNI